MPDTRPPKNTSGKTNAQNVRPNQRKPFTKATNRQVSERISTLTVEILTNPTAKFGDLERFCKSRFNISYRQAAEYITRAKETIARQSQMTKSEAKELGIGVLVDRLRKETTTQGTVAIEKRISEIFGYNAPTQHRIGDPSGRPLAPAVIAPSVHVHIVSNGRDLPKLLNGNGTSNGNGHTHAIAEHNGNGSSKG